MDNCVRLRGVVNETTNTIHRRETGKTSLTTVCGATYNLPENSLRQARIESTVEQTNVSKCGRCFDDGGGY